VDGMIDEKIAFSDLKRVLLNPAVLVPAHSTHACADTRGDLHISSTRRNKVGQNLY
jgi:hypothetical protein